MTDAELSSFVERFISGKVTQNELAGLTELDWQAIRYAVRSRRQQHLRQYTDALLAFHAKQERHETVTMRTHAENESLAKLEKPG